MNELVIEREPLVTTDSFLPNFEAAESSEIPVIADIMAPPVGVYRPEMTVAETIDALREETRSSFITYCYVVDPETRLLGVVVMREMLFAEPDTRLKDIMIPQPFALRHDETVADALKEAITKHYPVYPVVGLDGTLVGLVRGDTLFANQALEISAQAGSMVGVEREERLATPLSRSLLLRHPWLQVNLLTAFVAAGVVGMFQDTLSAIVMLAVFLPVMAGQTGNTGCQALAVTLRGMTLGDLKAGEERTLITKEATLGLFNGMLVGLTAGTAMTVYAAIQGEANPMMFGVVVLISMTAACSIAGIAGAAIPLVLKKLGADPATASSIFLTTASDVASIGIFLSLATLLLR